MSTDAGIVFAILGVAGILFASGKVRLDITSLLVVMALMLSGVLTPREAPSIGRTSSVLAQCPSMGHYVKSHRGPAADFSGLLKTAWKSYPHRAARAL